MKTHEKFIELLSAVKNPAILELGTKRSDPNRSTMHRDWVPHAKEFLGSDFQPGLDVDILADIHQLSQATGTSRFDGIISCSTFEHVQYPWVACVEICKALKPGGLLFLQTHQTFPLHAYPYDYWRFTKDCLTSLFCAKAGYTVIEAEHEFPCKIVSEENPGAADHPSFLNVVLLARKTAEPVELFWK